MTTDDAMAPKRRPDGPNPGILAVVALVLTLLGVLLTLSFSGSTLVSPLESTPEVARFYLSHRSAATVAGFFVFAASVPLGIYAATTYARMLRLGIRVPGPGISFYGGISASVFGGIAGLLTWVLGQSIVDQSAATIHTIAYASYALSVAGFTGGLGLLVAGIAVPTLILRLAPRWMAWSGLVLAAVAEISFLSLIVPPLGALLPFAHYLGLLWLVIIGFMLPRDRRDVVRGAAIAREAR